MTCGEGRQFQGDGLKTMSLSTWTSPDLISSSHPVFLFRNCCQKSDEMQLSNLLPILAGLTIASAQTVYLIRHGEKPADGGDGLNAQGMQRAQCLRTVFGNSSSYNIGKIIAEQPKSSITPSSCSPSNEIETNWTQGGKRARPRDTVLPLANDLGLTIDISCDRDDADCVDDLVKDYNKSGSGQNILICWEHDALTDIAEALGDQDAPTYPDDS